MTATVLLDLKQRLAKLSESERRQISAYLLRLKHETPAWKKETSERMVEMDKGQKVRLVELAQQLGHA